MNKYEIYANGKVAPMTTVEAERYYFEYDALVFCNEKDDDVVAMFLPNNSAEATFVKNEVNITIN